MKVDLETDSEPFSFIFVFFPFQAAESGNIDDFGRLFLADPSRLGVRDSRGRAAAHQAAARNKVNILQFITAHGGGKRFFQCLKKQKKLLIISNNFIIFFLNP